jgi:predicted unusual protein kinase regulating ubiquinone biosynthesis (AarF/ABC1/UbiB family)
MKSGEVAVPTHIPALSSSRVLTMEFEEGSYVTDLEAIQKMGLNKHEISRLVSKAFCEQMYVRTYINMKYIRTTVNECTYFHSIEQSTSGLVLYR